MRVLLVTSGYPPEKLGGAAIYVKYLAEELEDVHLFIPSSLKRPGNFHTVPPVKNPLRGAVVGLSYRNPGVERAFARVLEEVKPDVVHFHNLWAFRTAMLPVIARDMGYPTVITLHDYWFLCPRGVMVDYSGKPCPGPGSRCAACWNDWVSSHLGPFGGLVRPFLALVNRENSFRRRLETLLGVLRSTDLVIAPSRFLAGMLEDHGVESVHLPNGYPHSIFAGFQRSPHEKTVFGFVGVPSHQKGIHVAIRAALELEGDFELRIYGESKGAYMESLRKLADSRVRFMGRFTDVTVPYRNIDVLLFPSLTYENSPLVLAEAALTETPVIASNLGAIPEYVHHGANGFLFTPGDWRELSELMALYLEERPPYRRVWVPDDMPEHARKLMALYRSL